MVVYHFGIPQIKIHSLKVHWNRLKIYTSSDFIEKMIDASRATPSFCLHKWCIGVDEIILGIECN